LNFVTIDEVGHLPAGLSHWQTGSFAMYRVNPPLPRMLAVLPLLRDRPVTDFHRLSDAPGSRPEWPVGRDFASANASRYMALATIARLTGVAWSVLGAWLIWRWTRELYGPVAGLVSMSLWCFGPNVLAFAPLLVPDIPASVAGLAATYAFWRYLRSPSWSAAWIAGLLLGVAQLTKFTLLLLVLCWPVLWFLSSWGRQSEVERLHDRKGVLQILFIVLVCLLVINVGYCFEGSCRFLKDYQFVSRTFAGEPPEGLASYERGRWGNRFQDTPLGYLLVPLPADYVLGVDLQRRDFEVGLPSYLRGEWRSRGWWYYYLYALAVKVPLGALTLVVWGLALTLVGHAASTLA
jgi:hypothetical protein